MKVISLIPSMTETLLEAGVEVVGRTRFCIHGDLKIPVVGGTKDIDWEKVKALKADIMLLDREENPKAFADESPLPIIDIHVESIVSCAQELARLSKEFKAPLLQEFSQRYSHLQPKKVNLDNLGEWVAPPGVEKSIEYIIWKDPLMAVSRQTFIGDILHCLGHDLPLRNDKYPKIEFKPETTYLFSSEPYPFAKKLEWIKAQNVAATLVDGESFSWFGIRSLRFLESHLS